MLISDADHMNSHSTTGMFRIWLFSSFIVPLLCILTVYIVIFCYILFLTDMLSLSY